MAGGPLRIRGAVSARGRAAVPHPGADDLHAAGVAQQAHRRRTQRGRARRDRAVARRSRGRAGAVAAARLHAGDVRLVLGDDARAARAARLERRRDLVRVRRVRRDAGRAAARRRRTFRRPRREPGRDQPRLRVLHRGVRTGPVRHHVSARDRLAGPVRHRGLGRERSVPQARLRRRAGEPPRHRSGRSLGTRQPGGFGDALDHDRGAGGVRGPAGRRDSRGAGGDGARRRPGPSPPGWPGGGRRGRFRRLTGLNSARCPPDIRKRLISCFARKARPCPRRSAGCRCKGFAFVKRLLVASAIVASLAAASTPAAHASSTRTAGAQIQWTSAATAAMTIVTQYSVAGAQGNAAPTLLPSVAGVCAAGGAETNFTLTFGALNERPNAATACLYKNALAVSVNTNDAAGFTVNQYLDAVPSSGVGICVYPNGGAASPPPPAAGTFTGNNLTSCPAGGSIVPPGTGGLSSGGANPGNPGAGGLEFYSPSGTSLGLMTMAGPTLSGGVLVNMYAAEDVQVNLAAGASSTLAAQTGAYITLQLIPN